MVKTTATTKSQKVGCGIAFKPIIHIIIKQHEIHIALWAE